MHGTVLDTLIGDMQAQKPDHIAVTGDLVNLALNLEIDIAHDWLSRLGNPDDVSVVPGNHDAYVPGALDKSCRKWEPWMRGDGIDNHGNRPQFPYMRVRGPVALIGVSSARATAPSWRAVISGLRRASVWPQCWMKPVHAGSSAS